MFTRLFDLITTFWTAIWPLFVVPQYEQHVVLRFGKFRREAGAGLRWKWPLIEQTLSCSIVYTTSDLSNQSLVTKDGNVLTLSAAYRHRVNNAKVYLLETADTDQAVQDVVQITIADAVRDATWDEVNSSGFWEQITRRAAQESRQWGVRISRVGYKDLAKIRVLRHLVDQQVFGGDAE
jgi:regulator of protease activity HflC (stomatin/prohibitin superfamily)